MVELIIVITILAILATIAFVSFSNYTKSSRDVNRLATLTNIEKGLQTFQITTGKYPIPDSPITISDSGVTIGQQGYVGETVSNLIKASKIPTDPQDGMRYVYSKNEVGNKYQLMTFLESQTSQTAFISKSYADLSKRFPTVKGDNLGIILEEDNTPVSTGIILSDISNTIRKVYLRNEFKTGTGIALTALKTTYTKMWKNIDPNCDIDDIIIGNQIWAGCNSTLGTGEERGGLYHPGGCFNYAGVSYTTGAEYDKYCSKNNPQMASNAKESDWDLAKGVTGIQNNIWGKFYDWDTQSTACPAGWRQPTYEDFDILTTRLHGSSCLSGGCDGLGRSGSYLKTDSNNLFQALKLPLAGRPTSGGLHHGRGNGGFLRYYNSNEYNENLSGNSARIGIGGTISSSTLQWGLVEFYNYSMPVRCIKE